MLGDFDEPHLVRRHRAAGFYRRECALQRSRQSHSRMANRRSVLARIGRVQRLIARGLRPRDADRVAQVEVVLLKLRLMRLCHRAGIVSWGGICFLSFGPKGRNSIAQGAALGHEPVRSSQPQRGETPAMSPWSDAPLGLVDVLRSVTQGCALGYRVSPRWGKAAKQNTPVFGLHKIPPIPTLHHPSVSPAVDCRVTGG